MTSPTAFLVAGTFSLSLLSTTSVCDLAAGGMVLTRYFPRIDGLSSEQGKTDVSGYHPWKRSSVSDCGRCLKSCENCVVLCTADING